MPALFLYLWDCVISEFRGIKMLNTAINVQPNEISTSITRNWTEQAIECYKHNGNCSGCSIKQAHYSFDCQMPKVVEILKLMNGEPVIKDN